MNILVTGATGFLGGKLVAALASATTHTLLALTRPTSKLDRLRSMGKRVELVGTKSSELEARLRAGGIDLILHCATNYGRREISRSEVVEANLVLPLRLLDLGLHAGQRLVFVNTDTMLDKNVSAYSLSKKQFRDWLRLHAEADELVGINVALEHFFGPGDDQTKFVSSVVRSLLRREPRIALTPGEQQRDFVYIDDVVSAFLCVVEFSQSARCGFYDLELGRGEPVRIRDFVELAKKLSGNSETLLDFGALPYRPNETMQIVANTAPLRALGWRPAVSLEEGLARMVAEEPA